jgi:hypothetical protein
VFFTVQKPAPVYDITITPYQYAARVTWKLPEQENSSYITKVIICLSDTKCQAESREETKTIIHRLKPFSSYNIEIGTQDGYSQKSIRVSKSFTTYAGKHINSQVPIIDPF